MRWITFFVVVLSASTAAAQQGDNTAGWEQTFGKDAVVTHFRGSVDRVLVAEAGGTPEAAAAADALRDAYRAAGLALVMDASSVGDVGSKADADIVEAAAHLPVDVIVIVRVYPGAQPTAVVTMFSRNSLESAGGFAATRGTPLPAATNAGAVEARTDREPAASPNAGVSVEASRAVAEVGEKNRPRQQVDDDEDPIGNRVDDDDDVIEHSSPKRRPQGRLRLVSKGWNTRDFFLLDGGAKIDGADVYDYIGRDDLADEYRSRQITFWSLFLGGSAAATVGMVVVLDSVATCSDTPLDEPCSEPIAGWALFGAGGLAVVGSYLFYGHPVTSTEFLALADEDIAGARPAPLPVAVSAVPTRGGAMVGLSGRF